MQKYEMWIEGLNSYPEIAISYELYLQLCPDHSKYYKEISEAVKRRFNRKGVKPNWSRR